MKSMKTCLPVFVAVLLLVGGGSGAGAGAVRPCQAIVARGVLPVWARAGFSEARPRVPHVLGRSGGIVAILFAEPLYAPPTPKRNNKILWVARTPLAAPADLRISAQRMKGRLRAGKPVSRVVRGGPGPSIIDLPAPGCWRFTLRWARHTDTLDLVYRTPPRPA
ncbi:MAG: hypothetical protein QOC94_4654 [Actinoplanes sp.]|jgi:hypothetical protein|nr:hypothetical protein [Actinoplanes sp.]